MVLPPSAVHDLTCKRTRFSAVETSCSVIIPTHDRPELLVRAVASAFSALPPDGEVIVVDDGSKVPARECLSRFAGQRLSILENRVPLGGGGSPCRNRGAKVAVGRLLFFLDDDDEFVSGYCRTVLESGASDQADFGFTRRRFHSGRVDGQPAHSLEKRRLPSGPIAEARPFALKSFPFSAGFWISRAGFKRAGPFAETLPTNSDTEYCCRIYSKGLRGWYSSEPGVVIHAHPAGDSGQLGNVTRRTRAVDRAASFRYIAQEHRAYLSADQGAALFVHKRWMKHALRCGQFADAKAAIMQAPQVAVKAKLGLQLAGMCLAETLRPKRLGQAVSSS